MQAISTHPTHLFIGNESVLEAQTEHFLQKKLCVSNGCTYCIVCRQIRERQHANLLWVKPEKSYTLECIEPVLAVLLLQRGVDERYYIVLQHADFLTAACANALLKSLEEPPHGYYFILLASHEHMVLPTIRSRSIMHVVEGAHSSVRHLSLFNHFTGIQPLRAHEFLRALDESGIHERDSVELIDTLIVYWHQQMRDSGQKEERERHLQALKAMQFLVTAAQNPPMPGSSKLFWKNLFLQM
jgi:hypothetical protein